MNQDHKEIVNKFFRVLRRNGEILTTEKLAKNAIRWFPEYRDLGLKQVEQEITEYIYNN